MTLPVTRPTPALSASLGPPMPRTGSFTYSPAPPIVPQLAVGAVAGE